MKTLVLGVGNTLRGDDGFGPAVIEKLQQEISEPDVEIIDVGTSLSLVLWPYLLEEDLPDMIVVVDVVVDGGSGLRELGITEVPSQFFLQSSHLFPPRELLESLDRRGVEIRLLVCSVKSIENEITDRMSPDTTKMVRIAVEKVKELLRNRSFTRGMNPVTQGSG